MMVCFRSAVVACVWTAAAASQTEHNRVDRSLQTSNIEPAVVCYRPGSGNCNDASGNPVTSLPSGVPTGADGVLVVAFPHVAVTGTRRVTYYTETCTTLVTPDGAFGTTNFPTTPAVTGAFGTLAASTQFEFSFTTLEGLPDSVVQTISESSGGFTLDHLVDFCIRFSLLDASGVETDFREVDITLKYESPNIASLELSGVTDNNPTSGSLNFGDFTVSADLCSGTSPISSGEKIPICLVPRRQPDGSGTAVATTDIKISSIENFIFFIDESGNGEADIFDEVFQDAFFGGEVQGGTEVSESRGACAAGLTGVSSIHGCRFDTTLKSAFFDDPPASFIPATTGDRTITASGTVIVEYQGSRRYLQLARGQRASKVATTTVQATTRRLDDDGECAFADRGFWSFLSFILRPLCNLLAKFVFGPLFG